MKAEVFRLKVEVGSLRKFCWFVLKYFFGLCFKYFIKLKSLEMRWHCPVDTPLATRLVANIFWLLATDQRRNSWLSEVHVHTDSVIQIN